MATLQSETIFDTQEFHKVFAQTLDEVILKEIYYQSDEHIIEGALINHEELLHSFQQYYGVVSEIIIGNTEVNADYNELIVKEPIPEPLQESFKEYEELVRTRLSSYRALYIQNQLDEYKTLDLHIKSFVNFEYYIKNQEGLIIGGNASANIVENLERTYRISKNFKEDNLGKMSFYYQNEYLEDSNFTLHVGVRDPFLKSGVYYELFQNYEQAMVLLPSLILLEFLTILVMIGCIIYFMITTGQAERDGEIQYFWIDTIANEIQFLSISSILIIGYMLGEMLIKLIFVENIQAFWLDLYTGILSFLYVGILSLLVVYLLSITRRIKGKTFFKHTLLHEGYLKISNLLTDTTFRTWVLTLLCLYGGVNLVLFLGIGMLFTSDFGYKILIMIVIILLILCFNLFGIIQLLKSLHYLKSIMAMAEETANGNLDYELDLEDMSDVFVRFAKNIMNIQHSVKEVMEESVKGERMKSELITNVSHDLKTPLTSIISYVDLLKYLNLDDPEANKYIDVLQDKSYRLKQLIEDLIEASKLSSGTLTVLPIPMDYREITMQCVGEMEYKLESVGLDVVVDCERSMWIYADGRHVARIMENLLSNLVKYAKPNSQVKIFIYEDNQRGILKMKNESATYITVSSEQLLERFGRGDSARTTEGTGLGLSIAQSLTQLQDGVFGLEVDGETFEITVELPLWNKEQGKMESGMEKGLFG